MTLVSPSALHTPTISRPDGMTFGCSFRISNRQICIISPYYGYLMLTVGDELRLAVVDKRAFRADGVPSVSPSSRRNQPLSRR